MLGVSKKSTRGNPALVTFNVIKTSSKLANISEELKLFTDILSPNRLNFAIKIARNY